MGEERLFHPAEVNLLHGVVDWMFVDADKKHAWLTAGNSILPLHAMIPLVTVVNAFASFSEAVQSFQARRLIKTDLHVTEVPQGKLYTNHDLIPLQAFVDSLHDLCDMPETDTLHVWVPKRGCLNTEHLPDTMIDATVASQPAGSVISVPSSQESENIKAVVLQAILTGKNMQQCFWFASDLPAAALEAPWFHQFATTFPDQINGHVITYLSPRPCPVDFGNPYKDVLVQVLMDHHLTLMKCELQTPIVDQPEIAVLGEVLVDQFAELGQHQCTDAHTVVMTQKIQHGQFLGDILRLLAAMELTQAGSFWEHDQGMLVLEYKGEPHCLNQIADFWIAVLPPEAQDLLGRKITRVDQQNGMFLCFQPAREAGVMTPAAFAVQLAVLAFRTMFQAVASTMPDVPTKQILIKWTCRPLLQESVPIDITAGMIIKVLHHALLPVNGSTNHRLVHNSQQIMPDAKVADMVIHPTKRAAVLHVILQFVGGGSSTGSKNQQKMLQQTAISTFLLEQGYELAWVTQTVETLTNRLGLQKLQQLTSMPAGGQKHQALKSMLAELNISLPEPVRPQTRKIPAGLGHSRKNAEEMVISTRLSMLSWKPFSKTKMVRFALSSKASVRSPQASACSPVHRQNRGLPPLKKFPVMNLLF